MRRILLFIMLSVCMAIQAQRVDKPEEPYDYYCIVYKDLINFPDGTYYILDENDKIIDFYGISDMLTYLSKRGWTVVTLQIEYQHRQMALIKKTVKNDKEAKENLKLQSSSEKKKK